MHSIEYQDHITYLPSDDDGAAWSSLGPHNSLSFRPQYLHSMAVISVAQPNSRTPQPSSDTFARQPNRQRNPLLSGEHIRRKDNQEERPGERTPSRKTDYLHGLCTSFLYGYSASTILSQIPTSNSPHQMSIRH